MAINNTSSSTGGSVLTAMGLGSGLDIASLSKQLTTAEMAAPNARIDRQQSDVSTKVSALATLKSALSTFQATVSSINSVTSFNAKTAVSSDDTVASAVAVSGAAVGSYDVTVKQLAQSHQLLSNVFAGGASQIIGTGTLVVGSGTTSASVTIDSTNNTLLGIRNAINAVSGSSGVSATLVYGNTGAQLLLSSTRTGATNKISVSNSDGDGGLSSLVYSASATTNYTQKQAAQDSIVAVAGVDHTSASNFVSDAIDGVTLTLKKAQPATPVTLTIGADAGHVQSMMKSLVTAYNTLMKTVSSLGSYDASTKDAGPMLGDPLLTGIQIQVNKIISTSVASVSTSSTSLASLGLIRNKDGSMSLDSGKLGDALTGNFNSVVSVLSAKDGAINQLDTYLRSVLATGSSIDSRNTGLASQQKQIDSEKELIAQRTTAVQQRYLAKFNAMDTLLSRLQNTSSYLTQQFNALNKPDK